MTKPRLPAFDPVDLAESNAPPIPTSQGHQFPALEPALGDHVGLKNFGVNLTRIEPARSPRRAMPTPSRTNSSG